MSFNLDFGLNLPTFKRGKSLKRLKQSKTKKSGLQFSVSRVLRYMRASFRTSYGNRRIGSAAPVYLAAVLEYLGAEILELAGNAARDNKKKLISPRHIMLAIANDTELGHLLHNVVIPSAGVRPNIHKELIPVLNKPGSKTSRSSSSPAPPSSKRPLVSAKNKSKANYVNKTKAPIKKKSFGKKNNPPPAIKTKPFSLVKSPTLPLKKQRSSSASNKKTTETILSEKCLAGGQKLTVLKGDILSVKAQALVNPTNQKFYMNGEVGAVLSKAGGETLRKQMSNIRKSNTLSVTEAEISDFRKGQHLIHCHGPVWSSATDAEQLVYQLSETVENCLKIASDKQFKTIAFPSIGSGRAKFPKQTAAETILRRIDKYFKENKACKLETVYFVLYDEESVGVYMSELGKL